MELPEIINSISELEAQRRELDAKLAGLQSQVPVPTLNGRPLRADGFYYETINGVDQRICEKCEKPIPRYVDFPQGLTSPDSDGDGSWNRGKKRFVAVEGKSAIEPLRVAVCLDCYLSVFRKMYPLAKLPELSRTLLDGTEAYMPDEVPEVVFVGDPKDA